MASLIGHCLNDYIFVSALHVRIRGYNMMRFYLCTFPIHHKPREVQITMVTLNGCRLIYWSRFLRYWLDVIFTDKGYRWGLLPAGIQEGGGKETNRAVCLLPQAVRCCWGWVFQFFCACTLPAKWSIVCRHVSSARRKTDNHYIFYPLLNSNPWMKIWEYQIFAILLEILFFFSSKQNDLRKPYSIHSWSI